MSGYVARRLLGAVPLLLLISFISYALMGLAPGGPAGIMSAQARHMTPEARHHLTALLGLDKPWYLQYFYWLQALVFHGTLGVSYVDGRPVLEKIVEKLPITLELIGSSLLLTLLVALPVGIVAAVKRDSWFDRFWSSVGLAAYGIPIFWLAIVLIDLFAVQLRWLPSSGIASFGRENDPLDRARHLTLPVVTLTIVSFASWMRYQRGAMLEALRAQFIRTARAKGLSEQSVIVRHALPNAIFPVITLLGLSLPGLVGGAYFVEYVFSLPGLGYLGVTAIFSRDYPTVMGITLLSAILVVAGNLFADLAYGAVDPRIRYE